MRTEETPNGTLEHWTPQEVAEALARREIVLIDVRTPQEYMFEHVEGALLSPMAFLSPEHMPSQEGKRIVFHCGSGMRSAKVGGAASPRPGWGASRTWRAVSAPGSRRGCPSSGPTWPRARRSGCRARADAPRRGAAAPAGRVRHRGGGSGGRRFGGAGAAGPAQLSSASPSRRPGPRRSKRRSRRWRSASSAAITSATTAMLNQGVID